MRIAVAGAVPCEFLLIRAYLESADQQGPSQAADPACRQRQRLAAGFSKSCVRQRWRVALNNVVCSDPSPDHGYRTTTPTPNHCSGRRRPSPAEQLVQARRPEPSIHQQGGRMPVGELVCGLVLPPAPPQRDQIHDPCAATQWPSRGYLSSPGCPLRTGTPTTPAPVVTNNALLASAGSGVDQPAAT